MEDNPGLATRLERALFDDHFEVLLVSGDALPVSVLESQYAAFESAGLVVIYSCAALAPEAKRKLGAWRRTDSSIFPAQNRLGIKPTTCRRLWRSFNRSARIRETEFETKGTSPDFGRVL